MLLFDFEDEGNRVSEQNLNVPVDKLFLRKAAKTWLRPDNKEYPLSSLRQL